MGDYELIEEIARGGMGVVYRARQKSLNRLVAVKLILVGQWASATQVQRFKAEAAAAARLDHSNIVPIYEIGEASGQHFFSMRLVEGGNLAQWMSNRRGVVPSRTAVRLLTGLARAVHYAHQHRVLHRDLKPTNILIDSNEEPQLTDFGLAKVFEPESGTSISAVLLGTPAYMAPEQAAGAGAQITTTADIYSLGAILYELLVGEPPFTGESTMAILRKVQELEPESPRRRNPTVSRDLELICLKCLNKDPSRRYGSAEALAEDLDRWGRGEPIHARPVRSAERLLLWARRKPVIAGLSAALVALVVIASIVSTFMAWRIAAERDRATTLAEANRRQLVELNLANGLRSLSAGDDFESLPWLVEALRLDADNNSSHQRNHRTRLASVIHELPALDRVWFHDDPVTQAIWFPDGSRIVCASGQQIHVWNAKSGAQSLSPLDLRGRLAPDDRRLDGTAVSKILFSPDGRILLGVCGPVAQLWSADTGQPVGPPLIQPRPIRDAVFSPDGREVWTAGEDQIIRRWSVEVGRWAGEPIDVGGPAYRLAWSPDGRTFALGSVREFTRLWDRSTSKAFGEPLAHTARVLDIAFTSDGTRVVTAGSDSRARLWDAVTGRPTGRLFWHTDEVTGLLLSPDGKQLFTFSQDHTAKIWSLIDETRAPLTLNHGAAVTCVALSPDGSQVATASADLTARLWDAVDGRPLTPPLLHNAEVLTVQFSTNGRQLLTASADGSARLWTLPVPTPTQMLFRDSWWFKNPPAVSPNGRFALLLNPEGTALVWDLVAERIVAPALNHPKPAYLGAVTDDGRLAITACYDGQVRVWNCTGDSVRSNSISFYARNLPPLLAPDRQRLVLAEENGELAVIDLRNGTELTRIRSLGSPVQCGAYAPDGRHFAISAQDGSTRVFDATSGTEIAKVKHATPVVAVSFSSACDKVASADESGRVLVWSVADPEHATKIDHPRRVGALRFSPDGGQLLTGCDDAAARLWDLASGALLLPPMQHASPLRSVMFSPDGRRAATVDHQLNGQLWELDTGHPLTPVRRHHTRKTPDAEVVLGGTNSDWNWNLPLEDRALEELILEVSVLSGRKLDRVGGLTPLSREEFSAMWERWRLARGH